jgi:hypothetical protein
MQLSLASGDKMADQSTPGRQVMAQAYRVKADQWKLLIEIAKAGQRDCQSRWQRQWFERLAEVARFERRLALGQARRAEQPGIAGVIRTWTAKEAARWRLIQDLKGLLELNPRWLLAQRKLTC